jgi:hypothetical protein
MRRLVLVLAVVLATSGLAWADVIHLQGGGRIDGEVVEERADAVVIEVSAGRITLPRARIDRMVLGTSALARFRARAAALAPGDVRGWLALAAWARDNDLLTQSRGALEHVLAVDPSNAAAHSALGHVLVGGQWLTVDESHRARGLVEFEGGWVSPQERQALVAERAAEAALRREQIEADARIREAEARARAAEAEARRIEAEQPVEGGIPYPWVLGGGGFGPVVPVDLRPLEPLPPPPVVVVKVEPRRERERRDRSSPRPAASSSRGVGKGASRPSRSR